MSRSSKWKKEARKLRKATRAAKKAEKQNKRKFGRSKEMTAGSNLYNGNPGKTAGAYGGKKDWKKPAVVEEEYWEIEIECVEACSKAPGEVVIWIRPLAKVKIDALMEKFPNIEWFAYMLGETGEENSFIVNDLYIPKQTVTGTSVDEIDAPDFNKLPVIGALHSHHGMGNGFSGTDHKYVNGNHNISLVISKDGVAGQVRWQTPCGALKIVDAKVKPLMEVDFDKDSFLKTETEKINEKSYQTSNFVTRGAEYGLGGQVFPHLNQQEQSLVDELDQMDETEAGSDAGKKKTSTGSDEWVNEDQSLPDALKEAFGDGDS